MERAGAAAEGDSAAVAGPSKGLNQVETPLATSTAPGQQGEKGGCKASGGDGDGNSAIPVPAVPDEVLLAVFQWLPYWELLRGPRGVCRRWRRVALDTSLWDQLVIKVDDEDEHITDVHRASAALRVAPCLRSLTVSITITEDMQWVLARALTEGDCAIAELCFEFANHDYFFPTDRWDALDVKTNELIPILERQAGSGHLRRLALLTMPREIASDLLATALRVGRFSEMDVSIFVSEDITHYFPHIGPYCRMPHCPSLSVLRILGGADHPVLLDLLTKHVAALSSVTVEGGDASHAVEELEYCEQLRVAHIPAVPVLRAFSVSSYPLLASLHVTFANPVPHKRELLPFFRDAVQIRQLSLQISEDQHPQRWSCDAKDEEDEESEVKGHDIADEEQLNEYREYAACIGVDYLTRIPDNYFDPEDVRSVRVADLLSELGSSKRSELRELRLGWFYRLRRPLEQRALWSVLLSGGFPHLREVHVTNVPPADVLDTIAPGSAPALRVLDLAQVYWFEVRCQGLQCRYPALFRLVRRNPLLHVFRVPVLHCCSDGDDEEDDDMKEHCFESIYDEDHSRCDLFGHSVRDKCDVAAHILNDPHRNLHHWHFVGTGENERCSRDCFNRYWKD